MAEQLFKLSPHRDLQCYFLTPSAVAAMSGASETGFTLSGKWRQQFDWAVVEWNRDNVFEHPALRYLPDGDLSGLTLSYQETRTGCIPIESKLYPVVDWPSLRVWADSGNGTEEIYYVSLLEYATPISGSYQCAQATMTLTGAVTAGDAICIWMPTPAEQHYWYQLTANDTLSSAAAQLANTITSQSQGWTATSNEASILLTWVGTGTAQNKTGADGNRVSVYGAVSQGATAAWVNPYVLLNGGAYPSTYEINMNFSSLMGYTQPASVPNQTPVQIPTTNIRKMRWTWTADIARAGIISADGV